jgi:hypothetical protein
MGSRSACGRKLARLPIAAPLAEFIKLPADQCCAKCLAAKQANEWVAVDWEEQDKAAGIIKRRGIHF